MRDVKKPIRRLLSPETRLVNDQADGREYLAVQLGGAWWLAENIDIEEQGRMPGGVMGERSYTCENARSPYVRVYTWGAARHVAALMAERLEGAWRMPSDEDWRQMLMTLGGYCDRIAKKFVGENPQGARDFFLNRAGANSCFNRGLMRCHSHKVHYMSWQGVYWSASGAGLSSQEIWCYAFTNGRYGIYRFNGYRRNAYALRLVED
jgi:uncharacterized protein (TIGR02145 family)